MANIKEEQDSWHYTEGTLTMLSVSVAQIKSILNDGGESVAELTESFIELADTLNKLMDHKTDIEHTDLSQIKHQIEQGIIAFQFYDRISQRLDHVSNSLQQMSHLISDESKRKSPDEWEAFQSFIQSKFTMESERKLFAAILNGVPIEQALASAKNTDNEQNDDSIELF